MICTVCFNFEGPKCEHFNLFELIIKERVKKKSIILTKNNGQTSRIYIDIY